MNIHIGLPAEGETKWTGILDWYKVRDWFSYDPRTASVKC